MKTANTASSASANEQSIGESPAMKWNSGACRSSACVWTLAVTRRNFRDIVIQETNSETTFIGPCLLCMGTLRQWILVAVVMLGFSVVAASAEAESPAGVYVGHIEGQRIALRLEPDGSASLLGQHGTWRSSKGGVILSSEGESVRAQLHGDTIVFVVDGTRFALEKHVERREVNPSPSTTARAFAPKHVLKGKRFNVTGVNASFLVPLGWTAAYGELDGESGIAITNPKHPGVVFVVTATMLSGPQANATVPDLLKLAARDVLGDTPVQVVLGPEQFRVDGKDAGQLVLEGSDGMRTLRGRFGGVKVGRWGVGFMAFYEAKLDGTVTPVFETVLASFRAKAPKENMALAARIAGCWERSSGDSDYSGSSMLSSTYRFDGQGRYSYRYHMSVST